MKRMVIALAGLLLTAGQLYAGNGDLIVDGMLGVGTTSPTSKLDVSGPISAKCGFSTYTADGLFGAAATPVKIVTPHGQKFVVGYHDNAAGSYSPRIGFVQTYDAAISPSTVTTNASIGLEADGGLTFNYGANNAEGMRIINTGNVGIGTTSPNGTLTVRTTPNSGRTLVLGTTTPSAVGEKDSEIIFAKFTGFYESWKLYSQSINAGNGSADLYLDAYDTVTTFKNVATFKNNGNVGIGTAAPAYTLDVNGTIRGSNVSPSDVRLKENIVPVEAALEKVSNLRGVSFDWKQGETGKNFPAGRHYGVIAQEIENVLPEVVSTAPDGTKAVAYTEIIPVLIEAIKEQQALILEQRKQIAHQQEEIREVKSMIDGGI